MNFKAEIYLNEPSTPELLIKALPTQIIGDPNLWTHEVIRKHRLSAATLFP